MSKFTQLNWMLESGDCAAGRRSRMIREPLSKPPTRAIQLLGGPSNN